VREQQEYQRVPSRQKPGRNRLDRASMFHRRSSRGRKSIEEPHGCTEGQKAEFRSRAENRYRSQEKGTERAWRIRLGGGAMRRQDPRRRTGILCLKARRSMKVDVVRQALCHRAGAPRCRQRLRWPTVPSGVRHWHEPALARLGALLPGVRVENWRPCEPPRRSRSSHTYETLTIRLGSGRLHRSERGAVPAQVWNPSLLSEELVFNDD
jgi:hypothetical protein